MGGKKDNAQVQTTIAPPNAGESVDAKKQAVRGLLDRYKRETDAIEEARKALKALEAKRSSTVEEIGKLLAPKKKFMWEGKEVSIVTKGETWFFRGASTKPEDLLEV